MGDSPDTIAITRLLFTFDSRFQVDTILLESCMVIYTRQLSQLKGFSRVSDTNLRYVRVKILGRFAFLYLRQCAPFRGAICLDVISIFEHISHSSLTPLAIALPS